MSERDLDRVRAMPCSVPGCRHAHERSEAHHITGAGMSLKAPDDQTFPLCPWHHLELHSLSGYFKGWDGERLRNWQLEQVAKTWLAGLDDVF